MSTAVMENEGRLSIQPGDFRSNRLVIRDAQEGDVPPMVEIFNDYVMNCTASLEAEPESKHDRAVWLLDHKYSGLPVFVMADVDLATGAETIIGFASLSFLHKRAGEETVEASIYVLDQFRQSGFGEKLMDRLITAARERGSCGVVILTCAENQTDIYVARASGFDETGHLKKVGRKFNRWLDVCVFQKLL